VVTYGLLHNLKASTPFEIFSSTQHQQTNIGTQHFNPNVFADHKTDRVQQFSATDGRHQERHARGGEGPFHNRLTLTLIPYH
jgi:hypothetical protein